MISRTPVSTPRSWSGNKVISSLSTPDSQGALGLEEWVTSSGTFVPLSARPQRGTSSKATTDPSGAGSYRTGLYASARILDSPILCRDRSSGDEFSSLNGNSDPGVQGSGTLTTDGGVGKSRYAAIRGGSYKRASRPASCPIRGPVQRSPGQRHHRLRRLWSGDCRRPRRRGEYLSAEDHHGVPRRVMPSLRLLDPAGVRVGSGRP